MPIQTTKIEFKAKRIVFEINGGGKKGKKWYQRIQIGIGGTARPVVANSGFSLLDSGIAPLSHEGEGDWRGGQAVHLAYRVR